MKKIILLAVMSLSFALSSFSQSGTTGPLSWELTEDGVLTISGNGVMPDYDFEPVFYDGEMPVIYEPKWNECAPWYPLRETIIWAIIDEGVTAIGDQAFWGCMNLTSVVVRTTTPPVFDSEKFFSLENNTLYVPVGCVDIYKADAAWNAAFTTITEIQ